VATSSSIRPFELRDLEHAYWLAFRTKLPRAFVEAWEALCGAIYEGLPPEKGARKSRSVGDVWPLHRWDLIPTKTYAEKILAEITREIYGWSRGREKKG